MSAINTSHFNQQIALPILITNVSSSAYFRNTMCHLKIKYSFC